MGLGSYPTTSLSAARDRLETLRAQLKQGLDPLAEVESRKRVAVATAMSFEDAVAQYIATQEPGWKNAKLRTHYFR
jgi:predicted transcriptional regulator